MSKSDGCKHEYRAIYEDHILFGNVYYGKQCKKCGKYLKELPGPLDLGTYQ